MLDSVYKRAGFRFRISRITQRILAVNVGALLILVLGLLYSGQYEHELIRSELNAMTAEGRLLAAALAEGGVRATLEGEPQLAEDLSRHMLRKLTEGSAHRTLIFNKTGHLMLDSHQLLGPGGIVQILELDPPFATWSIGRKVRHYLYTLLDVLPTRIILPHYPRELTQGVQSYPHVIETLNGNPSARAWRDEDGRILLTASLPIQDLKNVLGAVLLTRHGTDIDLAVRAVQMTVLKLFLFALTVTILLSIYLSETIGYPILRLAAAAEKVRSSLLFKDSIPDFSYRHDEIGVLSEAFRDMTAALSERLDAISNFAADVAHEIRNPLASVKSAVETLVKVKDAAQRQKLLGIILEDVERLNRLINDISGASRIDSDISHAEKQRIDLVPVLESVAEVAYAKGVAKNRLKLDLPREQGLWVMGNGIQLSRVAQNIVDNAISFTSENGKIRLSGYQEGERIVLQFDNDGPLIPDEKLEKIFTRFYTERPKGEKFGLHSGLGLSICRQIIRAHQGSIFAQNISDQKRNYQGVRFIIVLPAGKA